ncbi:MAG: hypothetical protein Q9167_006615 [Letrouitia subvulpina]
MIGYRNALAIVELIVNQSLSRPVQRQIFSALGLVALAATVLCIVGGVSSGDSQDPDHIDNRTKAGVIVFVVTWGGLCLLLALVSWHVFQSANTPTKEQRSLVFAVALCTPLILVRIVYTLLSCFSKNPRFNMYTGNQTVRLVMALLEEFAVVIIFLIRGLALPVTHRYTPQQHVENSHGLHRVPPAQMKESANSSVEGNVHDVVQPDAVEAPEQQK